MTVTLKDNNIVGSVIDENVERDLRQIANKSICDIAKNHNQDLLIFPKDFAECSSDIGMQSLLDISYNNGKCKVKTGNLVGYFGIGNTNVNITSRFCDTKDDYFLHYMLQRLNCMNIINLDTQVGNSSVFDFLLYFFPRLLELALKQGLYKEYRNFLHNDANIYGSIDTARHIKLNTPFSCKIAYNSHNYTYDNSVTQLIRHTIEYIEHKKVAKAILTMNSSIRANVKSIKTATPTYNLYERKKVIYHNIKPVNHPYFLLYRKLQRLCIAILNYKKLSFGFVSKNIHGILIDIAWLWEEYLAILLSDFCHAQNQKHKGGLYLFTDKNGNKIQKIYPDFYKENIIADAKYIMLDKKISYSINDTRLTDIYYKTLSYMLATRAKHGLLLFPTNDKEASCKTYTIGKSDCTLTKVPFFVPQKAKSYKDFCEILQNSEKIFKDKLHTL